MCQINVRRCPCASGEQRNELFPPARGNREFVQALAEILNQRVEISVADAKPYASPSDPAPVYAPAAGTRANPLDEAMLQARCRRLQIALSRW